MFWMRATFAVETIRLAALGATTNHTAASNMTCVACVAETTLLAALGVITNRAAPSNMTPVAFVVAITPHASPGVICCHTALNSMTNAVFVVEIIQLVLVPPDFTDTPAHLAPVSMEPVRMDIPVPELARALVRGSGLSVRSTRHP